MEQVFLTKEEISELTSIQTDENRIIQSLGSLEYQIQNLSIEKDKLKQDLIKLQQNSARVGDSLRQKYGDGTINIETGEFTKTN